MTPRAHAKKCKIAPLGRPSKEDVKVKCGLFFIFFIGFLARLWRPHSQEDRYRFCIR